MGRGACVPSLVIASARGFEASPAAVDTAGDRALRGDGGGVGILYSTTDPLGGGEGALISDVSLPGDTALLGGGGLGELGVPSRRGGGLGGLVSSRGGRIGGTTMSSHGQ